MKQTRTNQALLAMGMAIALSCAYAADPLPPGPQGPQQSTATKEVQINGVKFKVAEHFQFFGWDNVPSDVKYQKLPLQKFTNTNGDTHYYQVVHVPSGNLNWFQAAVLAENAGGYLASISSEKENSFIFNMVNDDKYFWKFPKFIDGVSKANHYEISIGPFLGGYQPEGSDEPAGGWRWLSGEKWQYSNWAKNLDDGTIDKDPRPNDQPNDSGNGQRVMGFGEMNLPVPTWGDYMDEVGTYGIDRLPGRAYAFVMEFNQPPK